MAAGFQSLNDEALVHQALATEREFVEARFRHSMDLLEDTSVLRQLRRDIARMKTEQRARELAAGLPKGALAAMHRATFGEADSGEGAEASGAEQGGFLKGIVDKITGSD